MAPNLTTRPLTAEMIDAQNQRQEDLDATLGAGEGDDQPFVQTEEEALRTEETEPQPSRKPVAMSPGDAKRQAMIDKFNRPGVLAPFDGDMNKAENLYGEVAAEVLTPDPDADEPGVSAADRRAAAEPQPEVRQPRMITQTIRGKQVTKSEDEWLELARKVDAADSYLEESRVLLETAKDIRAERAGQTDRPNDGQTGAQDDGLSHETPVARRPPGELDLKSVIEKIQFGDPEEAAQELGRVITTVASQQADQGQINRLIANDLAKSQADLKAFRAANPELDQDKIASVVIENLIYDIYRDEIKALGMDESQIPANPKDLADWHRFYRVNGHNVSKTSDILTKAKDKFTAYRGGSPQQKPAPKPKGEARIAVNVDRTERRMAIPLQPTRAVVPRRDEAQPAKTPEQSRKEAVQDMRRQRGQPVV